MTIEWSFVALAVIILAVAALLHRFWPKSLTRMTTAKRGLLLFAAAALASAFAPLLGLIAFYIALAALVITAVASSYLLRRAVREYYQIRN